MTMTPEEVENFIKAAKSAGKIAGNVDLLGQADEPLPGNKTNGNGHSSFGLSAWNAGEDTSPPSPRGWLLGNTFCRRFLSSLFGDGGVGKTAVRYAQALALATGRNLTDEHVFQRARVLIVSLEDDANELRRRILAARIHFDIPVSEVNGWLFLAAPGAAGGKLMTTDKRGRAVLGQLSANIEAEIIAHSIDLVMLDPFVKSHGVEENLNSAIDDVAQSALRLGGKTRYCGRRATSHFEGDRRSRQCQPRPWRKLAGQRLPVVLNPHAHELGGS